MKIKQLKEKTIKGFVDFLPKIGINNIEGLLNALNDKLSKSKGGEVNKPIVITSKNSNYKITISDDGSIEIFTSIYGGMKLCKIRPESTNIIFECSCLLLEHLIRITDTSNEVVYENGNFNANKYALSGGTDKQVLLGDGSTTSSLLKQISIIKDSDTYRIDALNINGDIDGIPLPGATKKLAGLMTAADKAKLDDIEHTYVSTQNGNIYSSYDTNNGNTTLDVTGNYDEDGSGGKIRLKRTEDGKGKLSIMIDGQESSVNAEKFNSIISPNKNEVWSTDGGRINVLNLLKNAAIYVAGEFELAESGIDNTTVVDSPDSIIYDDGTKRFLARKSIICYTHWKADISKNIAPPSRYGIETDNGVFPFNNQMYKFSTYDNIFIATCANGTCSMKKLTLE